MIIMLMSDSDANIMREKLKEAGYSEYERKMYVRYSKDRGDSVFIHHSLQIIRSISNTKGCEIIQKFLGEPNGKVAESQDTGQYVSWFLNGYTGKSTTTVYK